MDERRQYLRQQLNFFGCNIDEDAVFEKCFELCESYNLNLDDFAVKWLDFCASSEPRYISDPTVEYLVEMENKVLKEDCKLKYLTKESNTQFQDIKHVDFTNNETFESDDVLSMYGISKAQPLKHMKEQKYPEVETKADTQVSATKTEFLPASYFENPIASSSQRNASDKGKILASTCEKTATSWKRTEDYSVEVTKSDEPHVPSDARYMYEVLSKQGDLLTSVCCCLGTRLFNTWSITGGNTSGNLRYLKNVRTVSQTFFRTFGRISTNKSANTVTLEGCMRRKGTPMADSIELDFRNVQRYSVFSGQIVAVEATNPVGDMLYVRDIFAKTYAPPPSCAPRLESTINIFVAAGPFTSSNNMDYQPLWNLMEQVASNEPHLLMLIGPFLEYTHPAVQEGLLKDTYHDQFEKILSKIMELVKWKTQVVIVPSNRDAHHEPIYPSPQYLIFNKKLKDYSNLLLMPDPCILNVSGLKIGATSVDVIKHIGKEEISNISGMDRLGRLADHVLAQTCFYPVYPPSEELNVDTELWKKYAFYDEQPHMLILPSDMRSYYKVINECVTFNPERLLKHTYARLRVKPVDGKWSPDNIFCEIVKL